MTTSVEDLSKPDFTSLLSELDETVVWELDEEFNTRSRALSEAVTVGTAGELRYVHRDTQGALYLRFPDYGTPPGAMEAILEQPFDRRLHGSESRFDRQLQAKYQAIVATEETAYLVPDVTAHTMAVVKVPVDFEVAKFSRALEATSTVSMALTDLHYALLTSLQEYR